MEPTHHGVFDRFARWEGSVPADTKANWLGVMTAGELADWHLECRAPEPQRDGLRPDLPTVDDEEYPEWIDLLEAVADAGDMFTMVELGAGYGRWLVNGAFAYRQLNPDGRVRLVGVEAEPTHFKWLAEHLARNGIAASDAELIEAAVAGEPGQVFFEVGNPLGWWGQSARERVTLRGRIRRRSGRLAVRAITLAQSLQSVPGVIDLIDLDVQNAEAEVLAAGTSDLDRVRRVHIGTHSHEAEEQLRSLFTNLGWICQSDYAANSVAPTTWWGGQNVSFQDGVQSWRNPRL
jgi:FkbM family methyltransferase